MPANRSLALVVRTVEVFETSLVVTLFTREMGKVAALAKGGGGSSLRSRVGLTCWAFRILCSFPRRRSRWTS